MRKMICGLTILVLLFAAGLFHAMGFRNKMSMLETQLLQASALLEKGEFERAMEMLEGAVEKWDSCELYTHVFIHQDRINAVSDCFYDYLGAIESSGKDEPRQRDKLLYHIRSAAVLELPGLGAIF